MRFAGTLASVCDYLEITPAFNDLVRQILPQVKVSGIVCDSRKVTAGSIFYAKKGAHYNPFEHLAEIKAKGAVAILIDAPELDIDGRVLPSLEDLAVVNTKLEQATQAKKDASDSSSQDSVARYDAMITDLEGKRHDMLRRINEAAQSKRSGYRVPPAYTSDPQESLRQYGLTDNTPEAKAIADTKMVRLVLPRNKSLSALAGFIYGNPSESVRVIGVTGTNGKSTITHLVAQMLNECGHKCAVFGTLGFGFVGDLQKSANTTIDAITLQQELAHYRDLGADYAVLEVSSIGFCEGRVAGIKFYAGAFSNLTRDHLDYHRTMEEYFASKLSFLRTVPAPRLVVNCQHDVGRRIAEAIPDCYEVYLEQEEFNKGLNHALNIKRIKYNPTSLALYLSTGERTALRADLHLLGYFNAENFAVALGLMQAMSFDYKHVMRIAGKLKPITGRMECFTKTGFPRLIVDYAHTPDGVEQALRAAQSHTESGGRIFVVLGCGGDRDSGKRPLMALKASVYADYAIFTADNPRSEKLDNIIDDMLMAVDQSPLGYREVESKKANIARLEQEYHATGDVSLKALLDNAKEALAEELEKDVDVGPKVIYKGNRSMEEFDANRYELDSSIVNHAYRGTYYAEHQNVEFLPLGLPEPSSTQRNVLVIPDRYQAIRFALEHARPNDCIVIAGKGHEDYQIFADRTIHFSDREICCELLGITMAEHLGQDDSLVAVRAAAAAAAAHASESAMTVAESADSSAVTVTEADAQEQQDKQEQKKPASKTKAKTTKTTKTIKTAKAAPASKAKASKTASKTTTTTTRTTRTTRSKSSSTTKITNTTARRKTTKNKAE